MVIKVNKLSLYLSHSGEIAFSNRRGAMEKNSSITLFKIKTENLKRLLQKVGNFIIMSSEAEVTFTIV